MHRISQANGYDHQDADRARADAAPLQDGGRRGRDRAHAPCHRAAQGDDLLRPGARRLSLIRDAAMAAVVFMVLVQAAYFFHNRALQE